MSVAAVGLGVAVLVVAVSVFFGFIRNTWVLMARLRLIDTDFAAYKRLPPYQVMVWSFWIWDVRRFAGAA